MASELQVTTIRGVPTGSNANQIVIPTGQKVVGTDANSIIAPGMAINSVEHQWGNQTQFTTAQTWVDLTGSTYSYTTKAANSKILIIGMGQAYMSTGGGSGYGIGIFRGTTRIVSPYSNWGLGPHGHANGAQPWHIQHLDAPGVAAGTALSYKIAGMLHASSGQDIYFNYGGSWQGLSNFSSMIITEIAQ